jgi:hypothetical protein
MGMDHRNGLMYSAYNCQSALAFTCSTEHSARVPEQPLRDLRLGTLGKITAGQEAGRVVEVIDDFENSGGFLIFTYADMDRSPEVFDSWVQTIIDVDLYFDESGWEVEWADH